MNDVKYLIKKCECCGKEFCYDTGLAYKLLGGKNGSHLQYFCTWKCLRKYEKEHPKRAKRVI